YGCGDAKRYGKLLMERGVAYKGFDISAAAVATANELGVPVQQLTPGGKTSLAEGTCDVAICFEVLEHLMEPEVALKEIHRVLKPDGVALFSVPNAAYWVTRMEFLLSGFLNPGGSPLTARLAPWNDAHIRFFNTTLLDRMLEKNGFKVVGRMGEPLTFKSLPYFYRKSGWHPFLTLCSLPVSWLGLAIPGLFSTRLFREVRKI
ncbi:MAG: methyltransferase domain-containing protein, partial [Verrucomicrobiota bacterium]